MQQHGFSLVELRRSGVHAKARIHQRAFSLVELSIVLVILGLLIGGILAGQSLIRAAELRSTNVQRQQAFAAIMSFRDKYLALPGDMPNATKFWGAQNADPATCRITSSTGPLTCDGDGDGRVGQGPGGYVANMYEAFRGWQQMANAGLMEGQYTGIAGVGGIYDADPGVNVPKLRIGDAGMQFRFLVATSVGACWWSDMGDRHTLNMGLNTTSNPYGPMMTPEEAWNMDVKTDDGRPGTGGLRSPVMTCASEPNCTTTDTASTSEYNVTNSSKLCSSAQVLAF